MQGEATSHLDPQVIAALVAFIGTVVAFFVRKSLETRSINRAVLAEIKRLTEVGVSHQKWWKERIDQKDTDQPLIPFSHDVYKGQVKKIGVLRHDLVGKAVRFYGYVDFLNALQGTREQYAKLGKLPEFDQRYLKSLRTCIENFGEAFGKDEAV